MNHTAVTTARARCRAAHPSHVARRIRDQRRGYAQAVLRGLARTHRNQPAVQVQRVVRNALAPLGVRLSPAVVTELAANIAAGGPVELPRR
jgi:hypothetical protein